MPGEISTFVPVTRAELTQPNENKDVAAAAQERQGAFVFTMAAEARRAYDPKRTLEQKQKMNLAERSLAGLGAWLSSPATDKAVEGSPFDTRKPDKGGLPPKEPPRIRIENGKLIPVPSDTPFSDEKADDVHEVTTFHNRTPDGKINLTVKDKKGNPTLISVDEATFVEMYMLGCKEDFNVYAESDAKPSTGSFLNKPEVQTMMPEFIKKNGDWTKMDAITPEVAIRTKQEVSKEMPIIHGFEPAAVRDAEKKAKELQDALPGKPTSQDLDTELARLTAAKAEAQKKYDDEKDDKNKQELQKVLNTATQAEETAKAALAVRQAQEAEVKTAKETYDKLKEGSAELAKNPPSDEALTKHINTILSGEIQSKIDGLQTDIAKLRAEQQQDKVIGAAGAQDRIDAKQKEIDAKQKEIDSFKLMTEHPEMTAAFVRQMQQGEVSKDIVDKIQKALVEGNASDLMNEVSGQAFKDKLAELMKKAEASKDPKMKDFLEKYKPLLVTGGIAVFVLYQIIIQAMDKEDGGKR